MTVVAFNFEINLILNHSVLPFAVANQSGQQSHAICGVKQSELQSLAVSVVVFQPHHISLHFLALQRGSLAFFLALLRIALYVVVVTFTDRVWDIEAVCLVLKTLHSLKMSILYPNRVDDGSSRCIEQRYSGRPAVTAPSRFIRAHIRFFRILLSV